MKALKTPFDATELARFRLMSEEKQPPSEIILPPFLGFEFGRKAAETYAYDVRPPSPDCEQLSDPESLETLPSLDDEDYDILDAVLLNLFE